MRFLIIFLLLNVWISKSYSQTHVFAQLNGSPVNTTGWTLTGAAAIGNVTGTGNSEVLLCPNLNFQSGAIFFNQPINLNLCNQWIAEFDFRIFDGTAADGIAFCFLDVPPAGFVNGGGLGIPASANGLKVCFDTYLNCATTGTAMPKLELRWGAGYDECWSQPTVQNTSGQLAAIRSPSYSHAKIVYNNGNIEVYINNVLSITGFQQFNFSGYLGFTAATGGSTDNHSIKNVIIYTNMPPSEAGTDQVICSGQSIQIGTTPNLLYTYNWTPAADLNNSMAANPVFTYINNTGAPVTKKLYVHTAFLDNAGCTSMDSISIIVLPVPSLNISASATTVCDGTPVTFIATPTNSGTIPVFQWRLNGVIVGNNSNTYTHISPSTGDVISCELLPSGGCPGASSNSITITVTPPAVPSITISGNSQHCQNTVAVFNASAFAGGTSPSYQWLVNGAAAGSNQNSFSSSSLQSGDKISCMLTSNASCISTTTAFSNIITVTILPAPVVQLDQDPELCQGSTRTLQAGNFNAYLWQDGSTAATYTVTGTGTYHVTVTDAQGCKGADTTVITTLLPAPSAFLPGDSSFCQFLPFGIQANGMFTAYQWSNGNQAPSLQVTQPGLYWLEVTNDQQCVGRDTVNYTLKNCNFEIYYPTAFTPDNNGRNDSFKPIVFNTLNYYRLVVYNRWGQQVFTTSDPSKGWDGRISSTQQPSGVFVWICTYEFAGQPRKTDKGTVMLIR